MPNLREDLTSSDDPQGEETSFGLPNAPGDDSDYSTASTKARKGVYVPLTPDGMIDAARFKPAQKSSFEYALKNSPSVSSSATPAFVMDRESIGLLYDGIAMSLQAVGKMFFKWPVELTQHLVYTEEQKEHLKEPTAKVIEKYAPEWLLKHQEVIMLAMVFSQETKAMVESAATQYSREMEWRRQQKAPAEARVNTTVEFQGAGAGEN